MSYDHSLQHCCEYLFQYREAGGGGGGSGLGLADQLTLFLMEGADYAHHITASPAPILMNNCLLSLNYYIEVSFDFSKDQNAWFTSLQTTEILVEGAAGPLIVAGT